MLWTVVSRYAPAVFCLISCIVLSFCVGNSGAVSWYCADTSCAAPLSRGVVGYNYKPPTEFAISNGYLSVNAGKPVKVYRRTDQPDILDVEFEGKRGFVPRTAIDVTELLIKNDAYVSVDGPDVPYDQDDGLPPKNDQKEEVTTDSNEAQNVIPNAVDKNTASESVEGSQAEPPAVLEENAAVEANKPAVEAVSELAKKLATAVQVNTTAPEDRVPGEVPSDPAIVTPEATAAPTTLEPVVEKSKDVTTAVGQESQNETVSTEIITNLGQGNRIDATVVDELEAVSSNEVTVEKPAPESGKKEELVPSMPIVSEELKPTSTQPSTTPAPVTEVKVNTVPENVDANVSAAATINPTVTVKQQPEPSAPQPTGATIEAKQDVPEKLPEPKVTFQAGDPFAGMKPLYPNDQPQVVSTKNLLRHRHDHGHHHHHEHGHGHHHHDHGHGHHSHDHSHGPAKGHSHSPGQKNDEHKHSHGHDHSHDHNHDHGHSHSHEHAQEDHKHDADHQHPNENPVAPSSTASEPVMKDVGLPKRDAAKPEYIPPEDATKSPIDYQKLVQDRIEGKTVPGLLSDSAYKDPSEGIPTPPPGINPAEVTEAPVIPGSSENALPASERQAAIDANPRYQNHPNAAPQHLLGRESTVGKPALPHLHSDDHHHDHHDHDHSHDESHHHHHEHADEHDHDHEDAHGNHDHHDHEHEYSSENSEEVVADASTQDASTTITPPVEVPRTAACSKKTGDLSSDVPCDELVPGYFEEDLSKPRVEMKADSGPSWKEKAGGLFNDGLGHVLFGWQFVVEAYELVSPDIRFAGMLIFAFATLVFMASAASDRGIRKALESGFEEYDYRKESELTRLREQLKILQANKTSRPVVASNVSVLPPPVPAVDPNRPCNECALLRQSISSMKGTIQDNEQVMKEHRENTTNLLSKNNEVTTELILAQKDRDDLRRQLGSLQDRYAELEKRKMSMQHAEPQLMPDYSAEIQNLHYQLSQLNQENQMLRQQITQFSMEYSSSSVNQSLQAERDEAFSNVKFLKQMLSEKEEEIRKIKTAEGAGNAVAHRDLQEKTEELRGAKRQVRSLQEELENMKREREAQVQLRCQTFRNAADKAQRDSLLARHEAVILRQQLEDVCRKTGEPLPVVTNEATTPPGLVAPPPLLFSGMGFPPGPPPPTLEAFRQQVYGHKSGSASPITPLSDKEARKERRSNGTRKHREERNGNGNDLDESDDDRRRANRTNRS